MKSIYFTALGGAQSVGSSCYYLRLGKCNVLLDCGTSRCSGFSYGPDLQPVLSEPFMKSLDELDHIYISHAHGDHIGYLKALMSKAHNAAVYMTPLTRVLSGMYSNNSLIDNFTYESLMEPEEMMDYEKNSRLSDVSFLQKIKHPEYRVAFFPAGHIPGAMMTLIEYEGRRILYTGDYSVGTNGYWLPDNLNIDVLIICGLHAKHPWYRRKPNNRIANAMQMLEQGTSVYLQAKEPYRVIEQLTNINNAMAQSPCKYPIYLDNSAMKAVRTVESLNAPIMQKNNYALVGSIPLEPHVMIGSKLKRMVDKSYKLFNSTYTLHEDYDEMKQFIKRINPRQALVVHCADGYGDWQLEQELMHDPDCRTQLLFPEEGQIYTI